MSTFFYNYGPGAVKALCHYEGPLPGSGHDGVITLDLDQHEKNVPELEAMLQRGGLQINGSGVSYTRHDGGEAHIFYRGTQQQAMTAVTSDTFLTAVPAQLEEIAPRDRMGTFPKYLERKRKMTLEF